MAKNTERKLRFNIIDVLIIVLVAALGIAAVALRNRSSESGGRQIETYPMSFTVELQSAPEGMLEQMKPGKNIYRSTDGTYLGTIKSVSSAPHSEIKYSETSGAFEELSYQENLDIRVTIENQGYSGLRETVIGSLAVRVGDELPVKGQGFAKAGFVVAVDTQGAPIAQDQNTGSGELEAVYEFSFTDCRDFVPEYYHVGDRLYDKLSGSLLGVVEKVETAPHFETQMGQGGGSAYVEKPGRLDVVLTLRGHAVEKADGYYLDGGQELKVGATSQALSQFINRTGQFLRLVSLEKK